MRDEGMGRWGVRVWGVRYGDLGAAQWKVGFEGVESGLRGSRVRGSGGWGDGVEGWVAEVVDGVWGGVGTCISIMR